MAELDLQCWTRRRWLAAAAGSVAAASRMAAAPSSAVAIARCTGYDTGVLPALRSTFDKIGGVGRLVAGKTVAIKINMSGPLRSRNGARAAWYTHWSHPAVVAAAVTLFGEAGAKRIRILEGPPENDFPLEENFIIGGWDPNDVLNAASGVEMENTGCLGKGASYVQAPTPGGLIYPGFSLNHSYADCDALVSIAKLKEHRITGFSLSLKNMMGAPPGTIYGDAAPEQEPGARPSLGRTMFHTGNRQPSAGAPAEIDPASPREYGYRAPRITVDVVKARPIDLAIVDGIESQSAAETAEPDTSAKRQIRLVRPGVLIAGFNPVSTDAVGAAVMGFDPMAERGAPPFENGDNTLKIAEEAGIGTRDLAKIEIAGSALKIVQFPFRER